MLLSACGSDAPAPTTYSAGTGGAAGEVQAAGTGGAAGAAGAAGRSTTLTAKERCRYPSGWPTLDSVLSMAEPLPDTGDVGLMVMTSRGLHWLADEGLYRLEADGKATQLATTERGMFPKLVASSSAVVWLWDDTLWALSLTAGATPAQLATKVNLTSSELLVDETHAYFEPAFTTPGGLTRIPLVGGPAEKVPTYANEVFAVHDGYAYYRDSGSISSQYLMRAKLTGGEGVLVDNQVGLLYSPKVQFDGSSVMYISTTEITRIDLEKPNSGTPLFWLSPAPSQGGDNYLTSMVLDGDRIVYADGNGTVGWVTTDGTQCENILIVPDQGKDVPGWPIEITLDAQYLYLLVFTGNTSEGALHRIARSKVGL